MTVETTGIKAVALGNGAATVWPYTFLIPSDNDLVLTLVDVASGNPTVISPVNYTVTGLGNDAGGVITCACDEEEAKALAAQLNGGA